MILHRFMSNKEYLNLLMGETLTNTTNHAANGQRSTSVGFCFFIEEPDKAIHWLSTIVSTDWCVTFDIPDQLLTKSRARYRDPEKDLARGILGDPATIWRTEWCLRSTRPGRHHARFLHSLSTSCLRGREAALW